MITTMERAALMQRASQLVETGGLCKGRYENAGRHCTVGSVRDSKTLHDGSKAYIDNIWPEISLLAAALRETGRVTAEHQCEFMDECQGGDLHIVAHWNDAEERTQEDVVTFLAEVAERLAQRAEVEVMQVVAAEVEAQVMVP